MGNLGYFCGFNHAGRGLRFCGFKTRHFFEIYFNAIALAVAPSFLFMRLSPRLRPFGSAVS
jgi:hypothetical protein